MKVNVADLKKLIKYEQRAKENKSECKTNVLDNYRGFYCFNYY